MKYFSTKNKTVPFSFEDAVLKGLPQDNGLFVPEYLPQLDADFLSQLSRYSFQEIGTEIGKHFVGNEIETSVLNKIINEVWNYITGRHWLLKISVLALWQELCTISIKTKIKNLEFW